MSLESPTIRGGLGKFHKVIGQDESPKPFGEGGYGQDGKKSLDFAKTKGERSRWGGRKRGLGIGGGGAVQKHQEGVKGRKVGLGKTRNCGGKRGVGLGGKGKFPISAVIEEGTPGKKKNEVPEEE